MKTEEKIRNFIGKTGMLRSGDRVTAGVSGGADSVFLFYMLLAYAEDCSLDLRVVHVHHGIRGSEADRDAAFVEKLCSEHGIPCSVYRRDVPSEAAARGMSLEEAGRAVRYEIFREAASADGGSKIALAHHRDDLAETVLFRIARGTGISGLSAMRPVNGQFIRPLLAVTREEITDWLTANGCTWVEDSTNRIPDASRNRLRLQILPLLRSRVNDGAAEHLAALSELAAEASDFIEAEAEKRAGLYLGGTDGVRVMISGNLLSEAPVMQKEILRRAFRMTGPLKDIGRRQTEDLLQLFDRQTGAELCLPHGRRAYRVPEGIEMTAEEADGKSAVRPDPEGIVLPIGEPGSGPEAGTEFGGLVFRGEILPGPPDPVPVKEYTKWVDYAKIKGTVVIRNRRKGDFITIDGEGHKKSLSDYFTDRKVPVRERDRIPLAADGSEIIWVVGMRLGAGYRITRDTGAVLKIEADGGSLSEAART